MNCVCLGPKPNSFPTDETSLNTTALVSPTIVVVAAVEDEAGGLYVYRNVALITMDAPSANLMSRLVESLRM